MFSGEVMKILNLFHISSFKVVSSLYANRCKEGFPYTVSYNRFVDFSERFACLLSSSSE